MCKKYRIIYWFNSIRTDIILKADNKDDAIKKFRESKYKSKCNGDIKNIIEIQELQ